MAETVQLIAASNDLVATIQFDGETPIRMTWGELNNDAQRKNGDDRYLYRYLKESLELAVSYQRQGMEWRIHLPRRKISDIIASIRPDAKAVEARREREQKLRRVEARREREQELRRVEAERRETEADDPWWPIPSWEVPDGIRFDMPKHNQGQIVEVSYGTFGRGEADDTDPYMHRYDSSNGDRRWYKRREVAAIAR